MFAHSLIHYFLSQNKTFPGSGFLSVGSTKKLKKKCLSHTAFVGGVGISINAFLLVSQYHFLLLIVLLGAISSTSSSCSCWTFVTDDIRLTMLMKGIMKMQYHIVVLWTLLHPVLCSIGIFLFFDWLIYDEKSKAQHLPL